MAIENIAMIELFIEILTIMIYCSRRVYNSYGYNLMNSKFDLISYFPLV